MKYNIYINQKAIIELASKKINVIDAVILDFIIDFCREENPKIQEKRFVIKEQGKEETYTWIDLNLVNQELPLLRFKQNESISQRLKKLEKEGFIKLQLRRVQGGIMLYVRITPKALETRFSHKQSTSVAQPGIDLSHKQSRLDNHIHNIIINNNRYVKEIFSFYKGKVNSNSRLTSGARDKLKTRLNTYTPQEILRAIDNFSKDEWWMENNKHRGIAWFFHSDDRIEQFLNMTPRGSRQVIKIRS